MTDAIELRFNIAGRSDVAVGQMAKIEFDGRIVAPLERHLVDPPRRLAAGLKRMVHGREVVIGRVEMRAVVGADAQALGGAVFAVRQLIDPHAHVFGHARRRLMVVLVVDLRQIVRRVARDVSPQRRGNVDQAACHAYPPLSAPDRAWLRKIFPHEGIVKKPGVCA